MPKPDGICNPVRNVLCHIGCRNFAHNVSGGVANPALVHSVQRGGATIAPLALFNRRKTCGIDAISDLALVEEIQQFVSSLLEFELQLAHVDWHGRPQMNRRATP